MTATLVTALELTRSVPFRVRSTEDQGDGLTLDGYAAVFGQPTTIDSWEGTFQEEFRMGAFRKTLRERTPLMQYDHGQHPLIGSIPIGRFDSLTEETQGLHVVGRLTDNWLIQPVRDAIRDGGITGMSIRFCVVRDEWVDNAGKKITDPRELSELLWSPGDRGPIQRTVIEARLLEAGPVAWPAYEQTSVDVRAAARAQAILTNPDRLRQARQSLAAAAPVELAGDVNERALAVELLRAGVTDDTPTGPSRVNSEVSSEEGGGPKVAEATRDATDSTQDEARMTDATIEDLVAAADVLIDQLEAALEAGDADVTAALLTALDETVDSQMDVLGIPDTDEADSDAAASSRPRAAARPNDLSRRSDMRNAHPESTTGAPPIGHPPTDTDAPPAAGHPSPTEYDARQQVARRLQATLSGVRKRPINGDRG